MGGRKSFSPGDILQAADVQDFLMDQTVMVFGGTAARGSGIASPTEGMISYRTDADALEVYTGTAWVPAAQAAGAATVTNRNLLYNSAMQVSQRGTSVTGITTGGYNTADRWAIEPATMGTWTQDIQNDAPTGSGFRRSFRMLCTTADAAPATSDYVRVIQKLEGQDLQRVRKGTSSAQKLTLSFWVKSNVTGTYVAALEDADNTRYVAATYSISASATWERKTITFPADTTGAFDNDNATSLFVHFWLGAGSGFTSGTLQTAWGTSNFTNGTTVAGQVNVAAATNNYWQVTGVQLETGDVATDFEFKSYGQELRECQRYYYRHVDGNSQPIGMGAYYTTTRVDSGVVFPVTMRGNPNLVVASGTNYYRIEANSAADDFNDFTLGAVTPRAAQIYVGANVSGTAGTGGVLYAVNASSSLAFNAEL